MENHTFSSVIWIMISTTQECVFHEDDEDPWYLKKVAVNRIMLWATILVNRDEKIPFCVFILQHVCTEYCSQATIFQHPQHSNVICYLQAVITRSVFLQQHWTICSCVISQMWLSDKIFRGWPCAAVTFTHILWCTIAIHFRRLSRTTESIVNSFTP